MSTNILTPEEIRALPLPIRRFYMRVLRETPYAVDSVEWRDYGVSRFCYLWLERLPELWNGRWVGGDPMTVVFRQRPGEGWRFWHADDHDGHLHYSIAETLYRCGSKVETAKVSA